MCNDGSPESPADWVAHVYVYGADTYQSYLLVYGATSCGGCAIPGALSSRVYEDDDIRSCLGYWSVLACCAGSLDTSDLRYGIVF